MNHSENEVQLSTPERKRAYIHKWLLENPHGIASLDLDSNEQTPPSSPAKRENLVAAFAHPVSPVLAQRPSTSCTVTKSPVLSGKRLASSPIIGGRRKSIKRIKVVKKLDQSYTKENNFADSKLQSKTQTTESGDHSNEDIFVNNTTVASTVKAKESALNFTFDDTESTKQNNARTRKKRIFHFSLNDTASQLIESASSKQDSSTENTEQNIQEANSDTDKTISDLIEDISTQVDLKTPHKCNEIPASQKISNPSPSLSPKSDTDVHISETTAANFNSMQTGTPTEQIDTVSTLDSRIDFGKASYILQHVPEKPKRKKTYQKGGLLDALLVSMAKEKSNINLLRHQVCRKGTLMGSERPFFLLQIVEYLPTMNDFQLLKCLLIEDSTDLLSGLLIDNRPINVINVPEISCIINTNEKPVLKVYEPWTIVDSKQLILHITRFIAIPSDSKNCSLINGSLLKKDLKAVREFHCPCIDENSLSNKCETKFHDSSYNMVKTVFNYANK